MIPLYLDLEQEWRGGQSQALLTLRGLRTRGHAAELVAARDGALARRAQADGIPVHLVPRRGARLNATRLLRRLLSQHRFNLIHANEPHALTAAWLAGAHRQLPVVASRRVAYPLQNSRIALSRYRAARRILAISRFVAENVVASGLSADAVEVVYEGVEVPPLPFLEQRRRARQRWSAAEDELLLGCVGYLLPEKGHEFLIRSLPTLRAQFPRCRVLLAGDGPCRESLETLARQLGVQGAVQFAGFVERVSQVYEALDVFAFPSLAEPLGTSLLAAMAYGLPVVAVGRGGVLEYIDHEQNGLLIPDLESSRYPEAIAAAAGRLLQEPETAKRLGSAARQIIQQRFTADHMVENTLRVYEQLCPSD